MPFSKDFNAICYLNNYPDLRKNWAFQSSHGGWLYSGSGNHPGKHQYKISSNPAKHWQDMGQSEGRVPGCMLPGTLFSPEFNGDAYLKRYPDVRFSTTYGTNPLGHYNLYGINEGRIPGYELMTETQLNNTTGVMTPGTVFIISDVTPLSGQGTGAASATGAATANINDIQTKYAAQNTTPGDGTVQTGVPAVVPPVTSVTPAPTLSTNTIMYLAGGGLLLFLLLFDKKKKKK